MKYLSLLVVVLVIGCASNAPTQPPTTLEWQYRGITDYEAKYPGGGVSKRYESEVGWIDVYRFSTGRDNWLEGTSDPGFKAIFEGAAQEIIQAQEQGHYRKVTFAEPADIVIAGHNFRRFAARYEYEGKLIESHTFITALNGQLLKYRMSFPHPIPQSLGYIITNFIEQTARGYENP